MIKYNGQNEITVLARQQVRDFDKWAIEQMGIPGTVLMENAGRSCTQLLVEQAAVLENPKICIVCGKGNNGGDGYVIARHLLNKKINVDIIVCGEKEKIKGDAKINLDVLTRLDESIISFIKPSERDGIEALKNKLENADAIVDAVFGTGLDGEVKGGYVEIINAINAQEQPVFAVDIPSGLDCDTGKALGCAVKADWTVTFAALKKGYENPQSSLYTGSVYIASIGVEPFMKS
jgi:NAD(P)H-hydrate epimerase